MKSRFLRLATAATAALVFISSNRLLGQTVYPKGTTIWHQDETFDGPTLFGSPTGEAILIDMSGQVVHRWQSPFPGELLTQVEPLENGNILCGTRLPGQVIKTVLELDWYGNVVWSYTIPPGIDAIHHDIERLPNGNTLLLCAQTVTVPSISPLPLVDDLLLEVSPAGNVVWSWFTYEHFDEFGFDPLAKQLIAAQGSDWAHTNAADPLPHNQHAGMAAFRAGNIVLSQRYTNIVFIVDRESGAVAWKVGPDDNLTLGQHAPYMIPADLPGAGNLLVFDNGSGTGYPCKVAPRDSRA